MTVLVEADLPITDETFAHKFQKFQVESPGDDLIYIRHHFSLPDLDRKALGKEIRAAIPWAIYRKGYSWIYLGTAPEDGDSNPHPVAAFNHDHTRGKIYHKKESLFNQGNLQSISALGTDQILLARVLADRAAFSNPAVPP
jgi:hypothetical protein